MTVILTNGPSVVLVRHNASPRPVLPTLPMSKYRVKHNDLYGAATDTIDVCIGPFYICTRECKIDSLTHVFDSLLVTGPYSTVPIHVFSVKCPSVTAEIIEDTFHEREGMATCVHVSLEAVRQISSFTMLSFERATNELPSRDARILADFVEMQSAPPPPQQLAALQQQPPPSSPPPSSKPPPPASAATIMSRPSLVTVILTNGPSVVLVRHNASPGLVLPTLPMSKYYVKHQELDRAARDVIDVCIGPFYVRTLECNTALDSLTHIFDFPRPDGLPPIHVFSVKCPSVTTEIIEDAFRKRSLEATRQISSFTLLPLEQAYLALPFQDSEIFARFIHPEGPRTGFDKAYPPLHQLAALHQPRATRSDDAGIPPLIFEGATNLAAARAASIRLQAQSRGQLARRVESRYALGAALVGASRMARFCPRTWATLVELGWRFQNDPMGCIAAGERRLADGLLVEQFVEQRAMLSRMRAHLHSPVANTQPPAPPVSPPPPPAPPSPLQPPTRRRRRHRLATIIVTATGVHYVRTPRASSSLPSRAAPSRAVLSSAAPGGAELSSISPSSAMPVPGGMAKSSAVPTCSASSSAVNGRALPNHAAPSAVPSSAVSSRVVPSCAELRLAASRPAWVPLGIPRPPRHEPRRARGRGARSRRTQARLADASVIARRQAHLCSLAMPPSQLRADAPCFQPRANGYHSHSYAVARGLADLAPAPSPPPLLPPGLGFELALPSAPPPALPPAGLEPASPSPPSHALPSSGFELAPPSAPPPALPPASLEPAPPSSPSLAPPYSGSELAPPSPPRPLETAPSPSAPPSLLPPSSDAVPRLTRSFAAVVAAAAEETTAVAEQGSTCIAPMGAGTALAADDAAMLARLPPHASPSPSHALDTEPCNSRRYYSLSDALDMLDCNSEHSFDDPADHALARTTRRWAQRSARFTRSR